MFKLSSSFWGLYGPIDSGSGGGTGAIEDKSLSKEDMIDFLNDDDDSSPIDLNDDKIDKKADKEDKEHTTDKSKEKETEKEIDIDEDEDDELKEIEEELEEIEPDDERLKLVTPARRKDILKAYPDLFKKFPYLEKAYYREQQYTRMFPTIDDAKEAQEKSTVLDNFEKDIMDGNTEKLLAGVKQSDTKAFNKLVDNYLPNLAKVDKEAYHHVVGNIVKHTIVMMLKEAKASGNGTLQEAAQILNQFAFASSEFTPPTNLATDEPKDNKNKEIEEREARITQREFERSNSEITARLENKLKATISVNIDPKETMTEYVRRQATREAMETVTNLIEQDSRFKQLIDKLWENSIKNDFSKASSERIYDAYISKARTLLPSVIKKARNEALKGMGKRVSDSDEKPEKETKRESRQSSLPNKGGGKSIPQGMSTLEYLNSED